MKFYISIFNQETELILFFDDKHNPIKRES
jgi:hypothetical protein